MFSTKYNISLLDSKWNPIKRNMKFSFVPRRDEFIYLVDRYYQVLNVVHDIQKKHEIFVIVEELKNNNDIKNEVIKK
jgi:hypothetical protein